MVYYGTNHVDGHGVVFVVGNDDVGKGFRGFDKLLVHGFQGGLVAVQNFFHVTATLGNVAFQSSNQSLVRIGVNEYLDVEQVAKFRIGKNQDSFDNHHFSGMGHDGVVGPVVRGKGIYGLVDGVSGLEFLVVCDQ